MKALIKLAIGALLLTLKLSNKFMETSIMPFSAILTVLIIAFLFASLPQVSHNPQLVFYIFHIMNRKILAKIMSYLK